MGQTQLGGKISVLRVWTKTKAAPFLESAQNLSAKEWLDGWTSLTSRVSFLCARPVFLFFSYFFCFGLGWGAHEERGTW
jgi:hypothetical protein